MTGRWPLVQVGGDLAELGEGHGLRAGALDLATASPLDLQAGRLALTTDGRALRLGLPDASAGATLMAHNSGVLVRSQIDHDLGIDLLA